MKVPLRRTLHTLKLLAMGHLRFELAERNCYNRIRVAFTVLPALSTEQRSEFEMSTLGLQVYPEVGTRAFVRMFEDPDWPWTVVQHGRYRYLVNHDTTSEVRIVISEYLACKAWVLEDG